MSDLIERQKVIDALDSINCCGWVEDSWKKVCGIIEHVPSKRMRGRWVKDEEASSQHSESIYVCSACNNMEAWGEVEKNTFKFCPNCGADMRGEQDG